MSALAVVVAGRFKRMWAFRLGTFLLGIALRLITSASAEYQIGGGGWESLGHLTVDLKFKFGLERAISSVRLCPQCGEPLKDGGDPIQTGISPEFDCHFNCQPERGEGE